MKPEVVCLLGLPASGKSTRAVEWLMEDHDGRIVINYDTFRKQMFGEGWVWNRGDEEKMKAHAKNITIRSLQTGLSVCVDNTNLSRGVRESWKQLAHQHGADYAEEDIATPIGVCIARDRLRDKGARVGAAVIYSMALRYGLLDWDE